MVNDRITLVDTNIIVDLLTDDPRWADWSEDALSQAMDEGPVVINPIIYAEIASGFDRVEQLDTAVPAEVFIRQPLPYESGFLAGKAFREYRRRGGTRRSPLPDFYIGAHAAVAGHRLLTRDAARYRTYFPRLDVWAPED